MRKKGGFFSQENCEKKYKWKQESYWKNLEMCFFWIIISLFWVKNHFKINVNIILDNNGNVIKWISICFNK